MMWIFLSALIVYLLALRRFFPEFFAPHCSVCDARMERRFDTPIVQFSSRWKLAWRKFTCPQCLYSYRRPVIARDEKDNHYEARALR